MVAEPPRTTSSQGVPARSNSMFGRISPRPQYARGSGRGVADPANSAETNAKLTPIVDARVLDRATRKKTSPVLPPSPLDDGPQCSDLVIDQVYGKHSSVLSSFVNSPEIARMWPTPRGAHHAHIRSKTAGSHRMISTARVRSMIRVHRICSLLGIGASSSNGRRTEEEFYSIRSKCLEHRLPPPELFQTPFRGVTASSRKPKLDVFTSLACSIGKRNKERVLPLTERCMSCPHNEPGGDTLSTARK